MFSISSSPTPVSIPASPGSRSVSFFCARRSAFMRAFSILFISFCRFWNAIATACAWATWSARFPGTRFIDLQIAAADILAIESGHCFGSLGIVGHFDEREAAGATRFPVGGDVHACDLSKRFKERAQVAFRGLEIHVADKQIFHSSALLGRFEGGDANGAGKCARPTIA
jgi:hypothetical protein